MTEHSRERIIFPEAAYARLRASPFFHERKLQAIGSMSVILSDPEGVLRLSRDGGTQCFLAEANRRGLPGVARVIADHGAVALLEEASSPEFIWAAIIERLQPIRQDEAEFEWLQRYEEILGEELEGPLIASSDVTQLREVAVILNEQLPPLSGVTATLLAMLDVAERYRMDLDLGGTNFMRRPSSGEIVLSDPVGSAYVFPADHEWQIGDAMRYLSEEEFHAGAVR